MILGLSCLSIVFLVLVFLANARRLKIAYLILGTFFLFTTLTEVPAVGRVFRNYNEIDNEIRNNKCHNFMGDIDVDVLENQGCPNKYIYLDDTRSNCPWE